MLEKFKPAPKNSLSQIDYVSIHSVSSKLDEMCIQLVEKILKLTEKKESGLILPSELYDDKRGIFPTYDQNRQFKKEATVRVRRYQSLQDKHKAGLADLIRKGLDPLEFLIRHALSKVKPEDRVVALDIQGAFVNEEIYRIVPFYDLVRSIEAFKELKSRKSGLRGIVKFMIDGIALSEQGGLIHVKRMPSYEHDDQTHQFYLSRLCLIDSENKYLDGTVDSLIRNSFNFDVSECCERSRNFRHYGRYVDEVHLPKGHSLYGPRHQPEEPKVDRLGADMLVDHHALLAMRIVKALAQNHGVTMVSSPAIDVDETTVSFTETLSRVYQEMFVWKKKPVSNRWVRDYDIIPLSKTMKNYWISKLVGYRNIKEYKTADGKPNPI